MSEELLGNPAYAYPGYQTRQASADWEEKEILGELVGRQVTLRLLHERYINNYFAMFSSQVQHMLHVQDVLSEQQYVHTSLTHLERNYTLFYCIFDNADNQLIGAIEIRTFNEDKGQLYNWLHENYWGGGRYQEALALISAEYFRVFDTHFFNAHVDVTNERSYRALQKFGCAHAGFYDGVYSKQYRLIIRKRI